MWRWRPGSVRAGLESADSRHCRSSPWAVLWCVQEWKACAYSPPDGWEDQLDHRPGWAERDGNPWVCECFPFEHLQQSLLSSRQVEAQQEWTLPLATAASHGSMHLGWIQYAVYQTDVRCVFKAEISCQTPLMFLTDLGSTYGSVTLQQLGKSLLFRCWAVTVFVRAKVSARRWMRRTWRRISQWNWLMVRGAWQPLTSEAGKCSKFGSGSASGACRSCTSTGNPHQLTKRSRSPPRLRSMRRPGGLVKDWNW